jgi:hypothetical protein
MALSCLKLKKNLKMKNDQTQYQKSHFPTTDNSSIGMKVLTRCQSIFTSIKSRKGQHEIQKHSQISNDESKRVIEKYMRNVDDQVSTSMITERELSRTKNAYCSFFRKNKCLKQGNNQASQAEINYIYDQLYCDRKYTDSKCYLKLADCFEKSAKSYNSFKTIDTAL